MMCNHEILCKLLHFRLPTGFGSKNDIWGEFHPSNGATVQVGFGPPPVCASNCSSQVLQFLMPNRFRLSASTVSIHRLRGLPNGLLPSTQPFMTFLGILPTSILWTSCPLQLSQFYHGWYGWVVQVFIQLQVVPYSPPVLLSYWPNILMRIFRSKPSNSFCRVGFRFHFHTIGLSLSWSYRFVFLSFCVHFFIL